MERKETPILNNQLEDLQEINDYYLDELVNLKDARENKKAFKRFGEYRKVRNYTMFFYLTNLYLLKKRTIIDKSIDEKELNAFLKEYDEDYTFEHPSMFQRLKHKVKNASLTFTNGVRKVLHMQPKEKDTPVQVISEEKAERLGYKDKEQPEQATEPSEEGKQGSSDSPSQPSAEG